MTASDPTLKTDQDLTEEIAQGHEAELVSKALSRQFDRRRKEVEKEIFQILAGEEPLAGEKAVLAWLEIFTVHKLEKDLRRRMQLGEAATRRVAENLAGPDGAKPSPRPRRFRNA
jgi:hypothetical protein